MIETGSSYYLGFLQGMARPPFFPFSVFKLPTPAFCVDRNRMSRNCERMLERTKTLGVQLRPHMKTHKTIEGGILMTGGTKRKIVVSTLAESEFFAAGGFDDILYGFPLTPEKIPRCLSLADKLQQFHILIDNEIIVDALQNHDSPKGEWSSFLAVDCGNGREGIHWEDAKDAVPLIQKLAMNHISFAGLYTHCGDSYETSPTGHLKATDVSKRTIERMRNFAISLGREGIECKSIGIGSTPSCSHAINDANQLTELHPGNYAFYDVQQFTLGSCNVDDIAVTVATRVVGHYPRRNELLIDCGFTGLTKQGMGQVPSGCVMFRDEKNLKLHFMTQEIGKVTTINGDQLDWKKYPIGSMLFMYPWHSCATAAQHPFYYIIDNEQVVETWTPCRGW